MSLLMKSTLLDKAKNALNNPILVKDIFKENENYKASPPKPLEKTPLSSLGEFPVPAYQFSVEILGTTVALFQRVTGMSVTRNVDTLTEGGRTHHTLEFPGQISYAHVTLEGGLTSSEFFWSWMVHGQYVGATTALNFSLKQYRHKPDGDTPPFVEIKNWDFFGAFPVRWKISDLDMGDSQKIVIESLELSFDYFELNNTAKAPKAAADFNKKTIW